MAAPKLQGYELYRALGSPKHVLAPMVDGSELAWRILSRAPVPLDKAEGALSKGIAAQLCYSPMINAKVFETLDDDNVKSRWAFDLVEREEGQEEEFEQWGVSDRPLVVQFCANDPQQLLAAAKRIEHRCDAVDINLGCPQGIAKRGRYGAFLMEDWDLIYKLINILHLNLSIPVTAKFRCYESVEKTVEYAKMLERAGAQILTCHGRTREMKGHLTGLADWEQIKAVKQAVNVPVFANGNILYYEDVQRCIDATGCDGVMSAEGNLFNPAVFLPDSYPLVTDLAHRYLDIVASLSTKTAPGAMKAHLFKIMGPALERPEHVDLRDELSQGTKAGQAMDNWRTLVNTLEGRLRPLFEASPTDPASFPVDPETGLKTIPHWLAQPHTRPLAATGMATSTEEALETSTSVAGPSNAIKALSCSFSVHSTGSKPCTNIASDKCPSHCCLLHCRTLGAHKAGLHALDLAPFPSASPPPRAGDDDDTKVSPPKEVGANAEDDGGEDGGQAGPSYIGYGCESHEAKQRARAENKQRQKEQKAERVREKKAKNAARVAAEEDERRKKRLAKSAAVTGKKAQGDDGGGEPAKKKLKVAEGSVDEEMAANG